jgi:hypothetical protein
MNEFIKKHYKIMPNFRIKIPNKILKPIAQLFAKRISTVVFEIYEEYIMVKAMDTSHICLFVWRLSAIDALIYKVILTKDAKGEAKKTLIMDSDEFLHIFHKTKKDAEISIYLQENGEYLFHIFDGFDSYYSVKSQTNEEYEEILDLEFIEKKRLLNITLPIARFYDMCMKVEPFTEVVRFIITTKLDFRIEMKDHFVRDTIRDIIIDNNFICNCDGCSELSSEIEMIFALAYIKDIYYIKAINPKADCTLEFSEDSPLFMNLTIGEESYLKYVLAPRVEEGVDEYD